MTIQSKHILFLLLVLSAVSCRKTYTCSCVTTISFAGIVPTQEIINSGTQTYSEKMTEKQAKSACDHQAESINSTYDDNIKQSTANGVAVAKTSCTMR